MINKRFFKSRTVEKYDMTRDVLKNPLMGFAPSAEDPSLVADNTLVYVDITMRELEPEEDFFDFETIEKINHFARWHREGRHVVLRLINDYPSKIKHLDIPDWLFKKTGSSGVYYDNAYGKGYSPDYTNTAFIKHHKEAVAALGKRYGQDSFISYIQLGSLGHWGEWHVHQKSGLPPIPDEKIRRMYVTPYIEAFPNAKIMMRRPFKITKEIGFGLYNDMIGHDQSTRQWMEWIEQGGVYEQTQEDALVSMPAYWESAPAGGEFTSAIPMSQLLTTNLDRTLEMLKETHTSFIGPHIPRENGEDNGRLEEGIKNVLQSVGYRIGVTKVTWSVSVRSNTKVKLIWENNGVAPMYWNWPVYLYFVDQDNFILDKTPVSIALTDLLPGKIIKTVSKFELNDKRKNARSVYIGIEDPMTDEPTVKLVSNQDRNNNLSLIKRLN